MADGMIPPWLQVQPAQFAEMYAAGQRLGSQTAIARNQLAQQQQQLAQRAQLAAMQAQIQQEDRQRQRYIEDQRFQIEKSYREEMLNFRKNELASKQQLLDIQTKKAADLLAAQQSFQKMYSQAGAAASIPELAMRSGLASAMGPTAMTKMAQMARQPTVPEKLQGKPGEPIWWRVPTEGGVRFYPQTEGRQTMSSADSAYLRQLQKDRLDLKKQLADPLLARMAETAEADSPSRRKYRQLQQELQDVEMTISDIYSQYGIKMPTTIDVESEVTPAGGQGVGVKNLRETSPNTSTGPGFGPKHIRRGVHMTAEEIRAEEAERERIAKIPRLSLADYYHVR